MNARKLVLSTVTILLTLCLAADSFADISNAAVLFLRIAPGSRAAAMGDTHVAFAEDATATHWNPAGLGTSPLSESWDETSVPAKFRPLTAIAPLSTGGGSFTDYDVWAISSQGLVRFDGRRWSTEEIFGTKTDDTVDDIVRQYCRVFNEERLAQIVRRVVEANSELTFDQLDTLGHRILAAVPESAADRARIEADLDSMMLGYDQARINWSKVKEAESRFLEGLEDSVLTEEEITRISVALERSNNRFIPEDLRIPYSVFFDGVPVDLTSGDDELMVAFEGGLAQFDGKRWQVLGADEGLLSPNISCLYTLGSQILVGTDAGISVYNSVSIEPLAAEGNRLPAGEVEAIGGSFLTDLYAVVNHELYHFNGNTWSNTTTYTAVLDDTIEKIAGKFSMFNSPVEKAKFMEKYREVGVAMPASVMRVPVEMTDSAAIEEPALAGDEAVEEIAGEEVTSDDAGEVGEVAEETVELAAGVPGIDREIVPGDVLVVPLSIEIKGEVESIHIDHNKDIWLGTEYGVLRLTPNGWEAPGYTDHVVMEGETLETIATLRTSDEDVDSVSYLGQLEAINDIGEARSLEVGDTVRVFSNPTANRVHSIGSDGSISYFATAGGLLEFDGEKWRRSDLHGFSRSDVISVTKRNEETWVGGAAKLMTKVPGHASITFTQAKWLPELADDLYYGFFGATAPVKGWGTFGGNVTFISYGEFQRTGETSPDVIDTFDSFDIAFTASYGTSLTSRLKGGVSAKVIYSKLAAVGAGVERGEGTSTGFAVDLGLMYLLSSRWTLGMAITNIGPEMAYIDAEQSDALPRNLGIGFACKVLQSDYNRLLVSVEINKLLVGLNDGFSEEIKELVINGGAEFTYANLISARVGYIYDQEGSIKTPTIGFGLAPMHWVEADFSYVPSSDDVSLANTLRFSLGLKL